MLSDATQPEKKPERGMRSVIIALAGAAATFCLIAVTIYYRIADVSANGWLHGGPTTLAAAMAGLFGGGLASVVVLILLLRRS
jgi:hypothetical protein